MNYSDFHLYTVAQGDRFVDAAFRCARSFIDKNPGLKFSIFVLEKGGEITAKPRVYDNIFITRMRCPEYFTPAMLKKKPCADILFFKYADAPFMLDGDAKYIGQVDADCLCMCKLPFEYFIEDLEAGKFCAASDPKVEVNKREIEKYWFNGAFHPIFKWDLYFNSGVCFWPRKNQKRLFEMYKEWVLEHIEDLSEMKYADQTWMNIFVNGFVNSDKIAEIGWYWNFRGTVRHPRAYIWHAGGRDSEGIEVLKKEFESWK